MLAMKGIVRHGKVEVEEPIDLPDGTELTISLHSHAETLGVRDDDWSNLPEAIEAWIRWYDALEPVEFTPDELAAWHAARKEDKVLELAQWANRSKRLEELLQ